MEQDRHLKMNGFSGERMDSEDEKTTSAPFATGSDALNPVDQDIKSALQSVAMFRQRPDWLTQLRSWNSSQFLNPNDPSRPGHLNRRCQPWKSGISARVAQRRHNPRRIDANQIGLKIHDKLPALEAVKVELRHAISVLKASKASERQTFFGNLLGIGADRRLVFRTPQTIPLSLGSLNDRRLRKARHIEPKGTGGRRDISIQRQIDFNSPHKTLSE